MFLIQQYDTDSQNSSLSCASLLKNATWKRLDGSVQSACKGLELNLDQLGNQVFSKLTKLNQYLSTLAEQYQLQITNLHLCEELKNTGIITVDPLTTKYDCSQSYHFALLQPSLKRSLFKKCQFRIKKKMSKWIGLGVCWKQAVQKHYFNLHSLGQKFNGYYLSSNAGYWSEQNSSLNGNYSGFHFQEGDRITVERDPIQKHIIFTNLDGKTKKEILYRDAPDDQLHFCVIIYHKDDQVQLWICEQ